MSFYLHLYLAAVPIWHRLRQLGGPGLLLLGIADNSVIPLTGSMDVLTIWLAARHREPWPYYTFMATVGAVVGGYITYALARKGGKEAMERKLSRKRAEKVSNTFERWGFFAVAAPALMPPPFPFVPFLLAAGAMQYPKAKFVGALTVGRGVRYAIAG
jgi:membrane protein YqaA with SNARE-associated domain